MRVGVLTGGGDCPGLNAVIRAVVRKGVKQHGFEFVGFRDGWRGPLEGVTDAARHPSSAAASCRAAAPSSARRAPTRSRSRAASQRIKDNLAADGVDALVAIGGEDTLGVATKLADLGVNVVGVPKTIDNDLSGTDFTFGFDTAVNIATEAIDRLHTTAESHHRVLVVEVMGRHAGLDRAARRASPAAPASCSSPSSRSTSTRSARWCRSALRDPQYAPIVVVAEGAVPRDGSGMTLQSGELDAFGHVRLGGIGDWLAKEIEQRTGAEARAVVLGHVQRGGTPDRVRPVARHPLRAAGDRRRRRRRLRRDGRAARHGHRPGAADRGHRRAQARSTRRSTPRRRSSSASWIRPIGG